MIIEIQEGSAHDLLSQIHELVGGQLTDKSFKVKNQLVEIESHIFSLLKGTSITVSSSKSKEELIYNIIGNDSDQNYLNFRFEYNRDLTRNINENIGGMSVYDTSYSFKTYNQSKKTNQWISIRIDTSQINNVFLEFGDYLKGIFSEDQNWIRCDIVPLEIHLLLKDIFTLDLNKRNPIVNSIILARSIECLGYFYERMTKKEYENKIHPDDLKQLLLLKDKFITPFKPLPSLSILSDEYGYSLSKLKRDFKSVFGNSIKVFHTELRLEKAKELLHNENRTITEVSRLVGYNSASKFSFLFKKQFGITPKEASSKYN